MTALARLMPRWLYAGGALLLMIALAHAGDLPQRFTPGVAVPALTKDKLCAKGFHTKSIREVGAATKKQALAKYHVKCPRNYCGKLYEIDHLISLEIGGSNDIRNLWPQAYFTKPYNARVKDCLENKLHDLVCAGTITLATAQQSIAANWISAYKKYGGRCYVPSKRK